MAAVWPDAVVTEDSLVQCVTEIRQALGPAARDWIRTLPRRGYAFVGPTETSAADLMSAQRMPVGPAAAARAPRPPLWLLATALALVVVLSAIGLVLSRRPAPAASAVPSIVVMPIVGDGRDARSQLAAEDLTETLTVALGRLQPLMVIAPSTAFTYHGKAIDVRHVGAELGVRYVLQGSLREGGAQRAVALALADAHSAVQLWSEQFDVADPRSASNEVVARVARTLQLRIVQVEAQRSQRERPRDPTAADLLARARGLARHGHTDSTVPVRARSLLEDALQRDPNLGEAWQLLAATYFVGLRFSRTPADDLLRAREAMGRAMELMPDSGDVQYMLGMLHYNDKRMPQALAAFDRALELSPNHPAALGFRGAALIMLGRPTEALAPVEAAIRISPRDPALPQWQMFIGVANLHFGHDDAAVDWLGRAADGGPKNPYIRLFYASALGLAGRNDDARAQMTQFQQLSPGFTLTQFRAREPSDAPAFLKQRERVYKGLRLAGMPE